MIHKTIAITIGLALVLVAVISAVPLTQQKAYAAVGSPGVGSNGGCGTGAILHTFKLQSRQPKQQLRAVALSYRYVFPRNAKASLLSGWSNSVKCNPVLVAIFLLF